MTDIDTVAGRLHQMVDGDSAPLSERSIENAAIPISPAQLEGIFGYGPTRSGIQINEYTAITFSAVYAAVKVLSESIGMLPIAIFEGDDDEDVKVRARDHAAYNLLRWQPNDEMTASTFKETVQANLTLWGNGYARIFFDRSGNPTELKPIMSANFHPERFGGQLRYVSEDISGGRFAPEEIIHVPGLTFNGVVGLSPVAYAREAIALGKAAEIFGATFFGNGGTVDGVMSFDGILKPEIKAAMREQWNAMHGGVGNAHKTAFIDNGGKYNRIGVPPEDAQFLETRKFQVVDIARIFRVPPHMIGDMDRATHSNIEQQGLEFLVYTLMPWLEKWEQEITRKLCGSGGKFHAKFDDQRLLRTDITARQAFYQIGKQWGFLNSDEIRAREGLEPLPNKQGQIYYAPVNMMPLDKFENFTPSSAKPAPDDPPAPPPAPKNAGTLKSAQAVRSVFEDAIGRMLRKESAAAARGSADDAFYTAHHQHVRESLYPAGRTLMWIGGHELNAETGQVLLTAIDAFAAERHGALGADVVAAIAATKSLEIPLKLLEQLGEKT